ncbi:MAG: sugar ABC transporter ATP-binding protein [Solirubrobacterales bacterium]
MTETPAPGRREAPLAGASRGGIEVELDGIGKRFESTEALADVSLRIGGGTVHALVGENGAGKSTLGRIVAGSLAPDRGRIAIDGRPVRFRGPRDALAAGIVTISQEISLVPQRLVLENVFLGCESTAGGVLRPGEMRRRYAELCDAWGVEIPAEAPVGSLSLAAQLKVELLRALAREARLIVMDEPTASLGAEDTEQLLESVRRLRAGGTTIVYVSHFLREVLAVADAVTVLRNGRLVRTAPTERETPESLVTAMLGRTLSQTFPPRRPLAPGAEVVCSVQGLSRTGVLNDVDLTVRRGEVLGLGGLVGSGRSEVARAIFGADRYDAGTVAVAGRPLPPGSPRRAIAAGVAMVPESRKDEGLVLRRNVAENVVLPHLAAFARAGVLRTGERRRTSEGVIARLGIRAPGAGAPVESLSGGNQQKVMFGKWLVRRPRLLIVDEPTRGVDIGAKQAIYELIAELSGEGVATLLISSDQEELLGLAHRIAVMRGGRVVGELDGATASEDELLRHAFGEGVGDV